MSRDTKQGTIQKYTCNRVPFGDWLDKSRGGAEKDGGRLGGVQHGPRSQESDVTRSNNGKTRGTKKLGGRMKPKIKTKGAKSKAGKEPATRRSVSSQGTIKKFLLIEARPEEVWNSPGNSQE